MIKLVDILLEIQQERQLEEGWKDIALGTAMTAASLFGGGDAKAQTPSLPSQTSIEKINPETEIKNFLFSPKNSYGWEGINVKEIYDFDKNGKVHVQGSGGEETMYLGKWILKGNKLIIIDTEGIEPNKTFTIKVQKGKTPKEDRLFLGNQVFKRYLVK